MLRRAPSLVIVLLLSGATASAAPPRRAPLPRAFVDSTTAFALDLYGRLRTQPGNLFYSPASVSTALALTWAGAHGRTAGQMKRALHLTLAPKRVHAAFAALLARLDAAGGDGPEIAVSNRLWVQAGKPLRPEFQELARASYGAGAELVDFVAAAEAARTRINRAVAAATRGRIPEILSAGTLDATVRLVLTSAIYFKGRWAQEFRKEATRPLPFYPKPTLTRTVPTMRQVLKTRYGETDDYQIVELPYRATATDPALAMVVLLPRARDGLDALEARLTPAYLAAALRELKPVAKVQVLLPRFGVTTAVALREALAAMGMPLPFDRDHADFSALSTREELYIGQVFHRAFVDVNEEGTEAAAATAVVMRKRNGHHVPVFRADHPFLFLIRDTQTGALLFMGRLVDPAPTAPTRP